METVRLFNDGWSFKRTEPAAGLMQAAEGENDFIQVDIPHDWLIYDAKKLYEDGCGWYRKCFTCPSDREAQRVFIRFDGVYMDTAVYLNGKKLGEWKYGYSTFSFEMTENLQDGENELLVQVSYQAPNSRWYTGAGIYRNVWLKICAASFLPFDGTYIKTSRCGEDFLLEAETEVETEAEENLECAYSLWKDGQEIENFGVFSCRREQEKVSAVFHATVKKPKLWDVDAPECYRLRVELKEKESGRTLDTQEITVGFRSIEFHPNEGLVLNNRKIKLQGTCEHHDLGCLGAAFHKEAMRKRLVLLRGMGVNALRTAHNMPAPEFMELADEMGFLVISEAFDMWERPKNEFDYARFFGEWAKKDVESWVRRDRNHPSLLLWSIGNEIYDTHADERGQELTRLLSHYVREFDPKENAGITIGSNYMPWKNAQRCADIVKIAGYNYGEKYYRKHHEEHPDWVIYGSETSSVVHSRGVYHFPLSQSMLADEDEQCSALGNSKTSWGAPSIEQCIINDRDTEFSFGQFIWSGFDYIGEPTPYHTKNSYFGQLDTAGFPKDSYYIFQAEWTSAETKPMVHLFPYWDFNSGQIIDVRACTNGAAVELFVNGESKGRQEIDHRQGNRLLGEWQIPYQKGSILAVAYNTAGEEIAREERHSFGDAARIVLEADREILRADGEDLSFLTISVVDRAGNPVENAMDYVELDLEGPGRLLGMDNGDSTDYDNYKDNTRKLFNGKVMAVIGTTKEAGDVTVIVSGKGLVTGSKKLTIEKAPARGGISIKENWSRKNREVCMGKQIPVRKVELTAENGSLLTPDNPELLISAEIFPENAADRELEWSVVNDAGILVKFASILEIKKKNGIQQAKVTAAGDGRFRIRCMSRGGTDKVRIISQLELEAKDFGQAYLNPYEAISAGLYSGTVGEIGNGNERGIATARDGKSGVFYSGIDFGEYGSDEITIPIFALSDEEYLMEIWVKGQEEQERRKLCTVCYQKPSIWNTYQEETWKLPERIKGIAEIGFILQGKVHIKSFCFQKKEKAYERLFAADCSGIYGDDFSMGKEAATGIGNNVTLLYEDMDFGDEGANELCICGRTPLTGNTIHVFFTEEGGEPFRQIVEFSGSTDKKTEYEEQLFSLDKIRGKGKIEFVFLPGSNFDLKYFQFR